MNKNNQPSVSILGCGWLGWPLALVLKEAGYQVKGSSTRFEKVEKLNHLGVLGFRVMLEPTPNGSSDFFDSSLLIINISPKIKIYGEVFVLEQIRALADCLKQNEKIEKVIFISSTSVYTQKGLNLTEDQSDESHFLVKSENILKGACQATNKKLSILRFGGLMGFDRFPAKYFAGKQDLKNGHAQVNYLHRDDAIGAIRWVFVQGYWGEIYNVVSPSHPERKTVILENCTKMQMPLPEFDLSMPLGKYKTVSVDKFLLETKYDFIFPEPLNFSYLKSFG